MKTLFLILVLFLLFSCSKNDVEPVVHEEPAYITEILSVRCSDNVVDSAWIHLDTIEKSFSPPIKEFDNNLFSKVLDSLYIQLDPVNNLYFKKPLLLPAVVINDFSWLSTGSDSIRIGAFEITKGFRSSTHWDISRKITGLINKYRLTGKYKRVYYSSDIKVNVRDNKGRVRTLKGQLKGSKFMEPFSNVTVW